MLHAFDERNRDLIEALDQQTASAEVLKVISRSTFDLQPVLDTLIANATRLCDAEHGSIHRVDGDLLPLAAAYGHSPELYEFIEKNPPRVGREAISGRAVLERRVIHVPDLRADPDYRFHPELPYNHGLPPVSTALVVNRHVVLSFISGEVVKRTHYLLCLHLHQLLHQ